MSGETTPMNRRIYMGLAPGSAGIMRLRLSPKPLVYDPQQMAVLLSRGVLPADTADGVLEVQLVSDPSIAKGDPGADGLSAYQLARAQGYGGTLTQWLASLVGAQGPSAYDLARAGGYGGTQAQWLATLKGDKGDTPTLSIAKVTTLAAGAQATASITAGGAITLGLPAGPKGDTGASGSTFLGAVTIAQTATVAISAGNRIVQVTVPAALGLAAGDAVELRPTALLAGYLVGKAVAVSATRVDVELSAPLLAIGASFSIPCRLFRLTL